MAKKKGKARADAGGTVAVEGSASQADRRVRRLEKRLAAARKIEAKRLRQLEDAEGSKGRKPVTKRRRQAGEAAAHVSSLAAELVRQTEARDAAKATALEPAPASALVVDPGASRAVTTTPGPTSSRSATPSVGRRSATPRATTATRPATAKSTAAATRPAAARSSAAAKPAAAKPASPNAAKPAAAANPATATKPPARRSLQSDPGPDDGGSS